MSCGCNSNKCGCNNGWNNGFELVAAGGYNNGGCNCNIFDILFNEETLLVVIVILLIIIAF